MLSYSDYSYFLQCYLQEGEGGMIGSSVVANVCCSLFLMSLNVFKEKW